MSRLNLYRNISITFIIFAAMILCAVFLLFYSQATIVIGSDPQTVNLNFVAEVLTAPTSTNSETADQDVIFGAIITTTTELAMTFDTASTKTVDATDLVGKVKIINNSSKSQQLVRTTQLQAENGVVVRTNRDVNVPAGGSVEVEVFPRDPEEFKAITSGKLTIIKLWAQLQPLIYGEVTSELSKKTAGEEIYFLAESDINKAKKEILDKAIKELDISEKELDISERGNVFGEIVDYSIDKSIGDETKAFTVKAKVKLNAIIPNDSDLTQLLIKKAEKVDLDGFSVNKIDSSAVKFSILDTAKNDRIVVKISYSLTASLTEDNEILNKNNFTNKTAQEIKNWAGQTGSIKEIETIISPYWRDTTPKDSSRIKIIIN
jgi:hypothetical protein